MNKKEQNSPLSKALREAGFIPLPRLWVKAEDYGAIKETALQYADEVNQIRYSIKDSEDETLKEKRADSRRAKEAQTCVHKADDRPLVTPDPYEIDWPGMN